jgi:hypothetical protein
VRRRTFPGGLRLLKRHHLVLYQRRHLHLVHYLAKKDHWHRQRLQLTHPGLRNAGSIKGMFCYGNILNKQKTLMLSYVLQTHLVGRRLDAQIKDQGCGCISKLPTLFNRSILEVYLEALAEAIKEKVC